VRNVNRLVDEMTRSRLLHPNDRRVDFFLKHRKRDDIHAEDQIASPRERTISVSRMTACKARNAQRLRADSPVKIGT
jgi:hypothetical protein